MKKLKVSCRFLELLMVTEPYTINDGTSSMFPLTSRSAQCKIKAQLLQECLLSPTLVPLLTYGEKFIDMIKPDGNQQKMQKKAQDDEVHVDVRGKNDTCV